MVNKESMKGTRDKSGNDGEKTLFLQRNEE